MLVATILGVLLIPMLFVVVRRSPAGEASRADPGAPRRRTLATEHGQGGH